MGEQSMNQRLVWNFEFSQKQILPLSQMVTKPEHLKWEIRYFWHEDQIISLYNIDDDLLDISHYKQKNKDDYYYLLPDCNYNIKNRRNELLYKPILNQSTHVIGFGAKINLYTLNDYPNLEPANVQHLQNLLLQIQKEGKEIHVKKESFSYKFATTPIIKLELARLEVNNKVYFSVCIEGKSLYLVETVNANLFDIQIPCDYVTFLKNIIKS
jgi:hypothetical protein